MPDRPRPSFRIHRVDLPPESDDLHYRAFWQVEGRTYRVHVWSLAEWERMPETVRPPEASPLEGPAWMMLSPVERGGEQSNPHRPQQNAPRDPTSQKCGK